MAKKKKKMENVFFFKDNWIGIRLDKFSQSRK